MMKAPPALLALGIISSQLYIFSSGIPQPSHIILLLFSIFAFAAHHKYIKLAEGFTSAALIFLCYSSTINIFYAIFHQDISFLIPQVYLLYNLIIFYSVSIALISTECLTRKTTIFFGVSILSLIFIWVSGQGRYYFFPRYNGFFNDPNQMAFWVLCCFSSFALLSEKDKIRNITILLVPCSILIFASMSRSAIIALVFAYIGVALSFIQSRKSEEIKAKILRLSFGVTLSTLFLALSAYYISKSDLSSTALERLTATDFSEQADIRGYKRILDYPELIIFGAGQGLDERFKTTHEIHSTWAAMLFYYGIPGLFIFSLMIYRIAKDLNLSQLMIFLAPLIYSFSTYGARTPIFWVFLGCAFYVSLKEKISKKPKPGHPKNLTNRNSYKTT